MAYLRPLEPELSDGRDEHGIMNDDEILQELSNAGLIERVAIPVHSQTPSQRISHSSDTLQDPDEEPGRVVLDLQDTDSDVGEADFDESFLPGLDDEGLSVAGTSGTRGIKRLRAHGS